MPLLFPNTAQSVGCCDGEHSAQQLVDASSFANGDDKGEMS